MLQKNIISGVRLSETFTSASSSKKEIYISFVINIFFVLLGELTYTHHVYASTLYVNYFTLLRIMTDGYVWYSKASVYQLNSRKHEYIQAFPRMYITNIRKLYGNVKFIRTFVRFNCLNYNPMFVGAFIAS